MANILAERAKAALKVLANIDVEAVEKALAEAKRAVDELYDVGQEAKEIMNAENQNVTVELASYEESTMQLGTALADVVQELEWWKMNSKS